MIRMKGEGMPVHQQSGDFGDLLVTFVVHFPNELTNDQKALFKQFFWS